MEKQKNQKEQILAERRDTFFKQKDEPRALERLRKILKIFFNQYCSLFLILAHYYVRKCLMSRKNKESLIKK